MPRSFRWARLLVLAGSCGLPGLGLTAHASAPPDQQAGAVELTAARLRSEAMRVELAWLADASAYTLALEVHPRGDSLEVRGKVPDEAMRQHVLQIARQNCYLPIRDGLTVASARAARDYAPILQLKARDALVRQLGSRGAHFQVSATEDGQIILKGDVCTEEDKLAASRCLRGLPGCSRVVNCLTINPGLRQGREVAVVHNRWNESANKPAVAPAPPAIQRTSHTSTETKTLNRSEEKGEPRRLPATSSRAASPYVLPTGTLPSGLPTTSYKLVHYGNKPACSVTSSTPSPVYVSPMISKCEQIGDGDCPFCGDEHSAQVRRASFLERLFPGRFLPRRKSKEPSPRQQSLAVKAPPVAPESSAATQPHPQDRSWREFMPGTGGSEVWPPAHSIQPVKASPAGSIYQSRPLATWTPPPAPRPPAPRTPASKPPAAKTPAPRTPPAVTPAAAKASEPVKPVEHQTKPDEAQRVVMKAPPGAVALSPQSGPPLKTSPTALARMVQKSCGKLADSVRVEIAADRSYIVHVHAKPATEQKLVSRLLSMPSLAASNIKLHVHLAP